METLRKEDVEKVFQQKVTKEDLQKAYVKSEEILKKVEAGFIKKEIAKIRILVRMIKDYVEGHYREVPWYTIATVVIILLYILNPFDLIPDPIPVLGQLDDLTVLILGWQIIQEDIRKYASWKIKQRDEEIKELFEVAFGK